MLNAVKFAGKAGGDPKEKDEKEAAKEPEVIFKLRDISKSMVDAWEKQFSQYTEYGVEVSYGDIFKGAPAADAIVSPANSFGFMDGGIDMVYTYHFGWQMQERLQKVINTEKDGEIIVGDAVIIPAYENEDEAEKWMHDLRDACAEEKDVLEAAVPNEGKLIKWLISAPTMRVPEDVMNTTHAYLAFRAVILAVKRHNADPSKEPIKSVLCPGLGTAVGRMPKDRCAKQMRLAWEKYVLGKLKSPESLHEMYLEHESMKD